MIKRRALGISIVLFWLIMMGLLVQRHTFLTNSTGELIQLERFSKSVHDRQWMAIYLNGNKIGYSMTSIGKTTVEATNEVSYTFLQRAYLNIRIGDTHQKVNLLSTAKTNNDFTLRSFEANLSSGVHQMQITGEVKKKELHLSTISSGREEKTVYPIESGVQLPITLEPYLASHGLETGRTYTMDVFDPLTASSSPVRVVVEGEHRIFIEGKWYAARKIKVLYRDMESTVWIDYDGRTLKEISPLGMTMVWVPEERAKAGLLEGRDNVDVLSFFSIKTATPIASPREVSKLQIIINNIDITGLTLSGSNQKIIQTEPLTLEINRPRLAAIHSKGLPIVSTAVDSQWLAHTTFIQSHAVEIVDQARQIVGSERDALAAARKINEWVNHNITKRFTLSIPSAQDVLQTREGDCNEHTTLFAALARSIGIPTKICIGIAYANDGFYYHAWPEVYIGQWLPLDPTFGQAEIDATHIKLLEGDLDQQFELTRLIGKIQVEIQSIEYKD